MNIARISLLFVGMVMLIVGCSTPRYSNLTDSYKMTRVSEPIFEMRAVRLSDSSVRISFVGTPTLRTPGKTIGYVEIYAGPDEDNMNDTITVGTDYTGAPGRSETLLLVGEGTWDTDAAKRSERIVMDVAVITGSEHIVFRSVKEYEDAEPMELTPFTQPRTDSVIDIGVIARRIFVPPGEHLPSSENLRLIISNADGQVIYRSDVGQQFLSIVTVLEPQVSNQMQRYAAPWNGSTMAGGMAPAGTSPETIERISLKNLSRRSISIIRLSTRSEF